MAEPAVPTYALYGEQASEIAEFWGHVETIESRSRIHGWEIAPHRHDVLFQILHVRRGAAEALLEGRWQPISLPAAIIVPPRADHGFRFSSDIDGAVITVVSQRLFAAIAAQTGLIAWLQRPRMIQLEPGGSDVAFLVASLDQIEAELGLGPRAVLALVEHLLAAALIMGFRISLACGSEGPAQDARQARLSLLIDTHFRSHLPVDFYAAELGLSATHLNRLVRSVTGRPLTRLLADRLIAEAKRDLVFTNLAVQQIAARLGFQDAAYFSRFFKMQTGLSPRRYREREWAQMHSNS